MNFERQDIGLGLFVLAAAAALVVGIVMVTGALRGDTTEIHVAVDSVTGLRKGATVFVEGYRVGEITRIDPLYDPDLRFNLTLAIDPSFPVYAGTTAIITNPGLIGDSVLYLQVPVLRGQEQLQDGAWIAQRPAPGLTAVMSRADTLARTVERLARRMEELLSPDVAGQLITQLQETLKTTQSTLLNLENRFVALSDSVQYGMRVGVRTLADLDGMLMENRGRIAGTLDTTQALLGAILATVERVNATANDQGPRLDRALADLDTILGATRVFMKDLNSHSLWQMLFDVRHPDSTATKRKK